MLSTQPARSCKGATGRRSVSSRGLRRIVSRLAGNTNSIFCEGHRRWPETANGCLVLRKAGALAEKAQIAAENSAVIVFARSSVARVGRTSFSLDKDLSWMSANPSAPQRTPPTARPRQPPHPACVPPETRPACHNSAAQPHQPCHAPGHRLRRNSYAYPGLRNPATRARAMQISRGINRFLKFSQQSYRFFIYERQELHHQNRAQVPLWIDPKERVEDTSPSQAARGTATRISFLVQ